MLNPVYTKQFKKDVKLAKRRGKKLILLKDVMRLLIEKENLPARNRDHKLAGNFGDCRECHLEGDWLLIYRVSGEEIFFVRSGTHADLFE